MLFFFKAVFTYLREGWGGAVGEGETVLSRFLAEHGAPYGAGLHDLEIMT